MKPEFPLRQKDIIAALQPHWLAWLRIRHPILQAQHADLAQEAAADMLSWLAQHKDKALIDEDIRRIGFRILQRRVADTFREQVRQWASLPPGDIDDTEIPDPHAHSDPEKALQYARLLKAIISILTTLSTEDRILAIGDELDPKTSHSKPRTPAERQRLSRVREKIRRALTEQYGIDARDWKGN